MSFELERKQSIDLESLKKYISEAIEKTLREVVLPDVRKVIELFRETMEYFTKYLERVENELKLHREYIEKLMNEVKKLAEAIYEQQKIIQELQKTINEQQKTIRELQVSIQAIGRRYGIYTEEAFRSSVKYIVEDLLKEYRVEKWSYYDSVGYVYGYPSQIDVDVLIRDREHILVEYKAHADRSDVLEIRKIAELYERVRGIKPRILLVAPTITKKAKELADKLGVETRGTVID